MSWAIETLDEAVDEEIEALPDDMRARLSRISVLIEEHGLERVREPHVKHVEGRLWEIRLTGRAGISRALYVTASGRRVVIVRRLCEKDGEDTAIRDCLGTVAGGTSSVRGDGRHDAGI